MTPARIQFLWKDSFTDQKITTLRRTVIATLGPEHSFWLELRPSINELNKQLNLEAAWLMASLLLIKVRRNMASLELVPIFNIKILKR